MKSIKLDNRITQVLDTKNEIKVIKKGDKWNVYEIDDPYSPTLRIGGATSEPKIEEVTGEEKEVKDFLNNQINPI